MPLTLFLVLICTTGSQVSSQTTDGSDTATEETTTTADDDPLIDTLNPTDESEDIPPPPDKVEVAAYFTEFTRQGQYPYQICAELPGEIGDPDTILTARSARCIPVESGELEFCAGVSYDVCSRVVSPSTYDEELQLAYEERMNRYSLEWPVLVTTECFDAFQTYLCLLGFPRCEEDSQNPGSYFELPLCYDYCVNAHIACAQTQNKAQIACDQAVLRGRVAPPRKDVTCVSFTMRAFGGSWVGGVLVAVLLVVVS